MAGTAYIEPDEPVQNPLIESFNSRLDNNGPEPTVVGSLILRHARSSTGSGVITITAAAFEARVLSPASLQTGERTVRLSKLRASSSRPLLKRATRGEESTRKLRINARKLCGRAVGSSKPACAGRPLATPSRQPYGRIPRTSRSCRGVADYTV
jgi:hypothetical protein